jgi:hypothetical protein
MKGCVEETATDLAVSSNGLLTDPGDGHPPSHLAAQSRTDLDARLSDDSTEEQ